MNDADLVKLKQQLLDLRQELQALESASKEDSKPVTLDQAAVGRLSRMDAMQSQQMALDIARRREQKLLKVAAALRRIESDEYGYCLGCDEEIDPRRLFVDPTNSRCVKCADK